MIRFVIKESLLAVAEFVALLALISAVAWAFLL
jgi:hypothetical protein